MIKPGRATLKWLGFREERYKRKHTGRDPDGKDMETENTDHLKSK